MSENHTCLHCGIEILPSPGLPDCRHTAESNSEAANEARWADHYFKKVTELEAENARLKTELRKTNGEALAIADQRNDLQSQLSSATAALDMADRIFKCLVNKVNKVTAWHRGNDGDIPVTRLDDLNNRQIDCENEWNEVRAALTKLTTPPSGRGEK